MALKHILFVCTANICRSPMARALFDDQLWKRGLQNEYMTSSVGIHALVGDPAAAFSQLVMAERGIDLRSHRARQLDTDILAQADLVLVMGEAQSQTIQARFPQAASKTHLLSEMAGETHDIPDPFGGPIEPYRACANELARLIEAGFDKILAMVERRT